PPVERDDTLRALRDGGPVAHEVHSALLSQAPRWEGVAGALAGRRYVHSAPPAQSPEQRPGPPQARGRIGPADQADAPGVAGDPGRPHQPAAPLVGNNALAGRTHDS